MSLSSFTNLKSFATLKRLKKLNAKNSSLEEKYCLISMIVPALPFIFSVFLNSSLSHNHLFFISLFTLLFSILFLAGVFPSFIFSIYPSYRQNRKEMKAAEAEILTLFESTDEQYQFIKQLEQVAQANPKIYPVLNEFKIAFVKKDQKQFKKAFSLLFLYSYLFEENNARKHPEQHIIDAFDSIKQSHCALEQQHHKEINGTEIEYSFKNHI